MIRASLYEKDINQRTLQINELENKLSNLKKNDYYNKYVMMDYIYKDANNLNYVTLYEYLNQLRNRLLSDFRQFNVNRFILQVQPGKVIIKTTVPNYDIVYKSWWMIDKLSSQVFVKKLNIFEFRNVNNVINFNIQILTK